MYIIDITSEPEHTLRTRKKKPVVNKRSAKTDVECIDNSGTISVVLGHTHFNKLHTCI